MTRHAVSRNSFAAGCSVWSDSSTLNVALEVYFIPPDTCKRPADLRSVGGLYELNSNLGVGCVGPDQATRRIAGTSPVIPTTNSSKIFASRADAESASG